MVALTIFIIMLALTRTMMMMYWWYDNIEFSSGFFHGCMNSMSHQLSLKSKTSVMHNKLSKILTFTAEGRGCHASF